MDKLQEYIKRYQGIHNGTDPYLGGGSMHYNNAEVGRGKVLFDGSQLGKKLPPFIQKYIDYKKKAVTLLDYGCGKALHVFLPLKEHNNKTLLGRFNGMIQSYYCYDPAVEIYNEKPSSGSLFDLVCCADVMEHIPEEFVPTVLDEIASYTKDSGVALFTISGNPAKKSFSDGENLHATLRSVEWWIESLNAAFKNKSYLVMYNDESKPDEPIRLRYKNLLNENIWNFENNQVIVNNLQCQVEEV